MFEIDTQKLVWRKLDNELVVLNLEEGSYFTMNEIGATIWEAISSGHNRQNAIDRIMKAFEADEATATADTTEFINLLKEQGLLVEKNCSEQEA